MPDEIAVTSTEVIFTGATNTKAVLSSSTEQIPNMKPVGVFIQDSLIQENASNSTTTDYQGLSALLILGCVIILLFGIIRILMIKKPDEKR